MLVVIAVSDEDRLAISAERLEGIIEESIKNDDDETRENFSHSSLNRPMSFMTVVTMRRCTASQGTS